MKPLIVAVLILSCCLHGCSEDEPEKIEIFPTAADVEGYWKLNKVYLDDVEVSFDNRELNLENEYYRISADNTVHQVLQLSSHAYATNYSWLLEKDLLQIGGLNGSTYKIQSFSSSALVMSPNARQNLELEYSAITEADFPETSFTGLVSGEPVNNTNASVDVLETRIELIGNTDSFFLAIFIPIDATAGSEYVKSETANPFGALIIRNNVDYGTLQSGTVKIIARTNDYIHVEFDFAVRENSGINEISVTGGSLRAIIMK